MAARHIFDDSIGVPGALNDIVAVILEPVNQLVDVYLICIRMLGCFQPLNSLECQPGVCVCIASWFLLLYFKLNLHSFVPDPFYVSVIIGKR